jgi:hypothetical protein
LLRWGQLREQGALLREQGVQPCLARGEAALQRGDPELRLPRRLLRDDQLLARGEVLRELRAVRGRQLGQDRRLVEDLLRAAGRQ